MDAGGAKHVGPPRTIDVQQFAASRSREVQALCSALAARQAEGSADGKVSSLTTPRQLRRRTASHNRRRPFRWTQHSAQSKQKRNARVEKSNTSTPAAIGTGEEKYKMKNSGAETPIASSSPTPAEPSSEPAEEELSRKRKPEKRLPSRRVRRRIELQGIRDGSGSCMRDGSRRLATHVWHAKRFAMTKIWGYRLPEGLPGRGRGSDALFEWVKEAAVLHDASYMGVIELQGTQDAILRTLQTVLEPLPCPSKSADIVKESELQGSLYGNAVLHNVGKLPPEAIAPVSFLWRPPSPGVKSLAKIPEASGAGDLALGGRQLWIWVHPSAFDCALQALLTACEMQGQDAEHASVKCRSRRGELAQFDLLGTKALQVLQKVLRPLSRKLACMGSKEHQNGTPPAASSGGQQSSSRIFANAHCLPMAAVLALDVCDPRDTPSGFFQSNQSRFCGASEGSGSRKHLQFDTEDASKDLVEEECVPMDGEHVEDMEGPLLVSFLGQSIEAGLANEVSDSPCLWSAQTGSLCKSFAPLSQKAFSEERRKKRKTFYKDINWNAAQNCSEAGLQNSICEKNEGCPVLLIRHMHPRPSASGWSLVMPITWAHAFWVPLVFAGGHAIGLRERHWLATDAGVPCFPYDFPDCAAHSHHLIAESTAFTSLNKRRPPLKRAPCWTVSSLQMSAIKAYTGHMSGSGGHAGEHSLLERSVEGTSAAETAYGDGIMEPSSLDDDIGMIEAVMEISAANAVEEHGVTKHEIQDCNTWMTEGGLLDGQVSLPCKSHRKKNVIPEITNLDKIAMTKATVTSFRAPVSPVTCKKADKVSEFQKLGTGIPTNESSLTVVSTSPEASQLQQRLSSSCEGEQSDSGRGISSGAKPSTHEPCVSGANIICSVEVSNGGNLTTTKYMDGCQSSALARFSPAFGTCFDQLSDMKSRTHLEGPCLTFFVARTVELLMKVLRESGLPHALFLHPGLISKGVVRDGLRQGRLEWRPSHTPVVSAVGGYQRNCYVRVLIALPRKGVVKENSLLCSPIKEDFDAFLSRSQRWQGIETSWRKSEGTDVTKEGKGKSREKLSSSLPITSGHEPEYGSLDDIGYEECSNHKIIGFITSTGPHGSSWSGTGFCKVVTLMKLRAMLWADQRWWNKKEILLLACNKSSPIMRPVLVTIALEVEHEHVVW